MATLESTVMGYMTRTRRPQRVSISDSLSGGGDVTHGFSILRKKGGPPRHQNGDRPRLREHVSSRRLLRNRSDVVRRIMHQLDDTLPSGAPTT